MAPLAEHTSDSENAMEGVCSMSCFSTTSTQIYDSTESSDDTLGNIKDPRDELKGWRPDVCKMLPQGVKQSIMLLRNLGLIDEKDNKANGLEAISHRAEYTPNRRHWDFDLSRLMKEDPAILARELSDESSQKFRRIPYEEFARGASGLPSKCIDDFLWHYELLAHKLYAKLIKQTVNPLPKVKKSMEEIKADPFIYAAIENSCQVLDPRSVDAGGLTPRLDVRLNESLRLVLNQLRNALSKPETAQDILEDSAFNPVRPNKQGSEMQFSPLVSWKL